MVEAPRDSSRSLPLHTHAHARLSCLRRPKQRIQFVVLFPHFRPADMMVCSQFTEEKLGQAEKTELDPHLENLLSRADATKNWTEKMLRQTEALLQPNPSE